MEVIVRGFGNGRVIFEESVDIDAENLGRIALDQIYRVVKYEKHMIELEFPDGTFHRFGNDPSKMVLPIILERRKRQ